MERYIPTAIRRHVAASCAAVIGPASRSRGIGSTDCDGRLLNRGYRTIPLRSIRETVAMAHVWRTPPCRASTRTGRRHSAVVQTHAHVHNDGAGS
jgi:hypothetical protein